jgi:hypothetical protein
MPSQIAERYRADRVSGVGRDADARHRKLRPYLRFTNLSNTGYQEITGVNMPPRTIMGGVAVRIGR